MVQTTGLLLYFMLAFIVLNREWYVFCFANISGSNIGQVLFRSPSTLPIQVDNDVIISQALPTTFAHYK